MGEITRDTMDALAHGLTLERAISEARGNSGPGPTPLHPDELSDECRASEGQTDPGRHGLHGRDISSKRTLGLPERSQGE